MFAQNTSKVVPRQFAFLLRDSRANLLNIAAKNIKPCGYNIKIDCGDIAGDGSDNTALGAEEVLVGDITYLRMKSGGFCYLATFQDVRTKRVVGWNVASRRSWFAKRRRWACDADI